VSCGRLPCARADTGADHHRSRDLAAAALCHHLRPGMGSGHRSPRHPARQHRTRRTTPPGGASSWRPGRALRGIETSNVISGLLTGSPARRLLNLITRCRVKPSNRYAGTDDW